MKTVIEFDDNLLAAIRDMQKLRSDFDLIIERAQVNMDYYSGNVGVKMNHAQQARRDLDEVLKALRIKMMSAGLEEALNGMTK